MVIDAAKSRIESAGGIWLGLLGYDALDRDSKQWKALEGVVQQSVEPVWTERLKSPRPLLITNAGPLVRYGLRSLLSDLNDTGTRRAGARWLLVPKAGDARAPLLEGRSVPLGPSGWIDLPRDIARLTDDQHPEVLRATTNGDRA